MYNPQDVVCFRCHKNPCDCPSKAEPPFSASNGSEKVIVYAGRHYGRAHRVISKNQDGSRLMVQFVDEAFEVHQFDTEPISPNDKLTGAGPETP